MDLMLLGLTIGMANALLALGLVLIAMANRAINFAHGEFGAFAVAMVLALTRVGGWNYWLAVPAALAATALLAVIVERTVIQRLFTSSRVLVLIATVGVAQVISVLRLVLPKPSAGDGTTLFGSADVFPVPFDSPVVEFGRVVVQPQHVMLLVAGPLLALALFAFLRWSVYGMAIRAAAENSYRARLLGIPARRLSTLAWVLAAVLAGAGSILLAPVVGFSSTEAVGLPLLMRGLAGATIAGFDKPGVAFGAGLAFGVLDQLAIFYTGRSGTTDAVLLAVLLVVLLLRRAERKRTTAAEESSWRVADPLRALPPEILAHPAWRRLSRVALGAGAAAVLTAPWWTSSSGTFLLASIAATSVVTLSLTVLSGWAGQLSLGQWGLAGVGGVLGSRLVDVHGVPFWLALLLVGVAGGLVAAGLGVPALRLPGTLLAVVTLGFAVASTSWLFEQPWFRGSGALPRPDWLRGNSYYYLAVAFLLLSVAVVRVLQASRVGRAIVAMRDNPDQAAAFGVDVTRAKLTAFVVSGVLASLAGFLWAAGVEAAGSTAFPPFRSLALLSAAIIGGLGSVGGAVLGTFYLLAVPFFGESVSPYLPILSTGVGLLVLVLVLPGGLAQLVTAGRDRLAHLVTGLDPRPRVGELELGPGAAASTGAPDARPAEVTV